ncbi:aldehyde dehydrogenase family protein [Streptomyces sp. NPDC059262]|uniref:aldehyde dehydrogenase family protein n=1 Tax=Streptomyces sp. NPDC059262 TaxID=3346797 RepID=UPI0036831082
MVRLLVDGTLTEAASGKRYENIDPATEEVLGHTADGSAEDMDRAIGAARRAFDDTRCPQAFRPIPSEDDADAPRIANDSPYGLSRAVCSADQDRTPTIARRIRTGSINVAEVPPGAE